MALQIEIWVLLSFFNLNLQITMAGPQKRIGTKHTRVRRIIQGRSARKESAELCSWVRSRFVGTVGTSNKATTVRRIKINERQMLILPTNTNVLIND
jgi:hypothetical protein